MNLENIVMSSPVTKEAINRAATLDLDNYYIGAGCITQTVWNHLSSKPLDYGISDIDFVYFDDTDLSEEAEGQVIRTVTKLFGDLGIRADVKNQARVHLWYERRFGYSIKPYSSLENAIDSWPTTATAIGVRRGENGLLEVYAPFGLTDLFSKTVRANKVQITEEYYYTKVEKWRTKWPDLNIVPW